VEYIFSAAHLYLNNKPYKQNNKSIGVDLHRNSKKTDYLLYHASQGDHSMWFEKEKNR